MTKTPDSSSKIAHVGRSVAGIVVKEGKFLVARRIPGGAMGEKWEFPGGKVEAGESDQEALEREFAEEFSVGVRVGDSVAKGSFEHGGCSRELGAFQVFLSSESFVLTEHTEWRWVEFDEIEELDFAESDRKLLPELRSRFYPS